MQVLGKETLPLLQGVFSIIQAKENRRGIMLNSRPIERSTLVSTKTSNGGIKRDVEGQGSTLKPLRMNQQGLSVMMEYDAPTIRRPITPKRPLGNSMGNPKE